MFKFWCERALPSFCQPFLDGIGTVIATGADTPNDPLVAVSEANAIIASARVRYNSDFMDRVPDLKVISRTGIGYDNIDLAAATRHGVVACYTPDGPTRSTAEHAITLMLATMKEVRHTHNSIERGEKRDYVTDSQAREVHGKTLGLIGLGRIGSTVAELARGLGMQVVGFDPVVSADEARQRGVELLPTIDDVFQSADVVSLHVPLSDRTRNLVGTDQLQRMKPGSFLVNCARGGIVDEDALVAALDSGHLAGAGVDVFPVEPPPADHPLLGRDDVVATPHIAGGTIEGKQRMWSVAIEQALQVCRGERPANVLNPDIYGN